MLLEKWYGSNWRLGKKHQHNMERGNGQWRLWGGSDMWLWPQRMSPWQPSFEDASQREERHSGRINSKEAPKGMVYEGEISNHLVLRWYIKHKASSSKRWGWRGRWIPDFGNPCKDMFIYYNFSFSKMHVFFFFTSIFWNQSAYNYFWKRLASCRVKEAVVMKWILPAHSCENSTMLTILSSWTIFPPNYIKMVAMQWSCSMYKRLLLILS